MIQATRILLVDDDPNVLRIFSEALRLEGYDVRETLTGRDALQVVGEQWPHLVITDVRLPDISGLEVCREIKSDPAQKDVFVALFSGEATSSRQQVAGLEIGADDYLIKTLPVGEFLARIHTLVRLRNTTAELRSSQERHRQVLELLPEVVCLIDHDGQVLWANHRSALEFGFASAQELEGVSIFDLLPPDEHDRLRAEILISLEKRPPRITEFHPAAKSGAALTMEISLAPLLDNGDPPPRLVLVARNVTERKVAEERIRLLADAVGSANECISVTDPQNRLVFINRAFIDTYGYSEEEVLGSTPEFLYPLAGRRDPPPPVYDQALGGNHWQGEVLQLRKDGTEIPVSLSTSQIKDPAGTTIGTVAVARDISERKRTERQNEAFSLLGYRLSSAVAPEQAARIIMEVASDLFGWDAGYVHLYSPGEDKIIPLLTQDTIEGQRVVISPESFTLDPSPFMRELMTRGAKLIDRRTEAGTPPGLVPFGDKSRPSAALLYAPIRSAATPIGILSIQSYSSGAYSRQDLVLLQALADYCGDALHRIDVTETLRKTEVNFRSIVENATEGIFQVTPDGRYLTANPALARMLGFENAAEMISASDQDAAGLYVSPKKLEELQRLLASEGAVEGFEVEQRRKDGSTLWVRLNAHAVRGPAGEVLYHEGTSQDVTERRWAVHLLRVQRDFGTLLSAANDLSTVVDRLLSIVHQIEGIECAAIYLVEGGENLQLAGSRGLSARFVRNAARLKAKLPELRANDAVQAKPLVQLRQLAEIVRRLKAEGATEVEVVPILESERILAVITFGSFGGWKLSPRAVLAVEAIAAQAAGALGRIKAEESLRASQETRSKMLNSIRAAVFVVDAGTRTVRECNSAATDLFGYSHDVLVGQKISRLYAEEAAFADSTGDLLAAARQHTAIGQAELLMRRKDGTLFPGEQNVTVLRDARGEVVGWITALQDTTDRKRAEAELRLLSRTTIEVQEAERMRIARELHDGVNQTLASVKMRLRRAKDLVGGASPAAREILNRCEKLLGQALQENRDLSHNLHPRGLSELGLIAACRNLCRELRRRTDISVDYRLLVPGKRLPPAIELNLYRILQEAVNNLEKHAGATRVLVRLSVRHGSVVLRIRDDGRGFRAQGKGPRKRLEPGIGLANIRQRAMSIGGTCEVESAPSKGTSITVLVPLEKPEKQA